MKATFLMCFVVLATAAYAEFMGFHQECTQQIGPGEGYCAGKSSFMFARGSRFFCCEDGALEAAPRFNHYQHRIECECMTRAEMCKDLPSQCDVERVDPATVEIDQSYLHPRRSRPRAVRGRRPSDHLFKA
ncbi:hypothetical protein RRG08_014033 [Elysia crispata]|uniref:Plethodontid modulating factor n=1 Tax=Elysia crispata TaxID=231223 RepID=A0AAE0ZZ76_9GAST|nr:hypothetical protein RRG08_014033 [Elysia crispata]